MEVIKKLGNVRVCSELYKNPTNNIENKPKDFQGIPCVDVLK
jgi:hypothetical protein